MSCFCLSGQLGGQRGSAASDRQICISHMKKQLSHLQSNRQMDVHACLLTTREPEHYFLEHCFKAARLQNETAPHKFKIDTKNGLKNAKKDPKNDPKQV